MNKNALYRSIIAAAGVALLALPTASYAVSATATGTITLPSCHNAFVIPVADPASKGPAISAIMAAINGL